MIEVSNLVKQYGSHKAVDGISFRVEDGEILGFLGPNGAGKSTTMNIVTGYLSATSGNAVVEGYDILEEPDKAKCHIGYLPEIPPLYLDMTVKEYLEFMYELKKCKLPKKRHLEEICALVKIDHVYGRLIKNLSKGYRQRVGFAQALIGDPKVLILDEPTVGLDPTQIAEMRSLIKRLGKQHTVILSSHILSEIESVCDRILIINHGRIIADDTAEGLLNTYSADKRLYLTVEGPKAEVMQAIKTVSGVKKVEHIGKAEDGVNRFALDVEDDRRREIGEQVFERLADRHWPLLESYNRRLSLEEIFLQLTQKDTLARNTEAERNGGKKK